MSLIIGLLAGLTLSAQPSAEDLYSRDFQGEFAPRGACARTTERWIFADREITEGPKGCLISGVSLSEGRVVVATRNCTEKGNTIPDRRYVLDLMSEDVVKARVDEKTTLLQRCPAS
ncbi:MAG: hypothetical protein AAGA69_10945 [Pseudomonadota bacterium]